MRESKLSTENTISKFLVNIFFITIDMDQELPAMASSHTYVFLAVPEFLFLFFASFI